MGTGEKFLLQNQMQFQPSRRIALGYQQLMINGAVGEYTSSCLLSLLRDRFNPRPIAAVVQQGAFVCFWLRNFCCLVPPVRRKAGGDVGERHSTVIGELWAVPFSSNPHGGSVLEDLTQSPILPS